MAPPENTVTLSRIIRFFASPRWTVALLLAAMALVFFGTLEQRSLDIYEVKKRYFESIVAIFPSAPGSLGLLPLPGGATLSILLAINLIAGFFAYHRTRWKKFGIICIHAGLLILLAGGAVSALSQKENLMQIREGEKIAFTRSTRDYELVFSAPAQPEKPDLRAEIRLPFPLLQEALRNKQTISHPALPSPVEIKNAHENALLFARPKPGMLDSEPSAYRSSASAGYGKEMEISVAPRPPEFRPNTQNFPAAEIAFGGKTLLVSGVFEGSEMPPQTIPINGKNWEVSLRLTRSYLPFHIELLEARHDTYPGTQIPRNYSSKILVHPAADSPSSPPEQAVVSMNHPLRKNGLSFFQSGMNTTQKMTIFQVVENPGWFFPYLALALITAGMSWQFLSHLRFLPHPASAKKNDAGKKSPLVPLLASSVAIALAASFFWQASEATETAGGIFASLPAQTDGRLKPIDSVARTSLALLSGKSQIRLPDGKKLSAAQWFAEMQNNPENAASLPVFRIDHDRVLGFFGWEQTGKKFFSFAEIAPSLKKFSALVEKIRKDDSSDRGSFETQTMKLASALQHYLQIQSGHYPGQIPPPKELSDQEWKPLSEPGGTPSIASLYADLKKTSSNGGDPAPILHELSKTLRPFSNWKISFEFFFNHFDPFFQAEILYLLAFLLLCLAWLRAGETERRAAWVLLLWAFALHSFGILARMLLQDRPPVTNLHSSALFVGWAAVALAALIEKNQKNGLGISVASACGFASLLVAPTLSTGRDSMEMMQAVLDSNFWLTTHVITISLGYSAMFVAGFLGAIFLLKNAFAPKRFSEENATSLSKTIYATTCFAMLFSFVGTMLGGVWADQSWGRFWGWDPKENGALLIVLACAIFLHVRIFSLLGNKGQAALAVAGNIVTAWSWFGTNMLGVGLHSYGFAEQQLIALGAFIFLHLLLLSLVWANPKKTTESLKAA